MQESQNNTKASEDKYQAGGDIQIKIGKTTYDVCLFYNKDSKASLDDKIKDMIREDVKRGDF